MKRALQEKEIQNILQEDIPSDPESCVESDSDCGSEPDIDQAPEFTLGNDTVAVQTFNDNFDSDDDIPLANFIDLLNDKILACGTVNATRKDLPTLKEDTKLERGEHDYRVSDTNVTVMKCKNMI
ncbi:unnamed protein product [Parnassius apollo]|uniref:(apollo) hypothetical protein n=1 Tax=Parnassius apollo TaxID=110799 RepID=A0A8S3WMF2_PARAO|nr:unnamed protein product [Parnassius apollo]